MTDTPHDALFKAAFEKAENAAGLFREHLPAALVEAIDWNSLTLRPGSFVDPQLAGRHSDLLFAASPHGNVDSSVFFYLLLEHQSTNDDDMPLRVLIYAVRIWERFRKDNKHLPLPPIVPLVISHVPGGWTAPTRFSEMFAPAIVGLPGIAEHLPEFTVLVDDLAHISNADLKRRTMDTFGRLTLWLLRDARSATTFLRNLPDWAAAFSSAALASSGAEALHQVLRYVALVTDDMHFEAFRAKLKPLAPAAEVAAMTIAEQLRSEGRAEGEAKGRVEGRAQTVIRQLTLKFGELSEEQRQAVATASPEQLDSFVERVLFADSIDAVLSA